MAGSLISNPSPGRVTRPTLHLAGNGCPGDCFKTYRYHNGCAVSDIRIISASLTTVQVALFFLFLYGLPVGHFLVIGKAEGYHFLFFPKIRAVNAAFAAAVAQALWYSRFSTGKKQGCSFHLFSQSIFTGNDHEMPGKGRAFYSKDGIFAACAAFTFSENPPVLRFPWSEWLVDVVSLIKELRFSA